MQNRRASASARNTIACAAALVLGASALGAQCQLENDAQADPTAKGHFGRAVSIFGNRAFATASHPAKSGLGIEGYVSVYRYKPEANWELEDTWESPVSPSSSGPWFGHSVDTEDFLALVGAPWATEAAQAGRAYLYEFDEGEWSFHQTLKADGPQTANGFGFSVSISGDDLAIGAPAGGGSVFLFTKLGSSWVQVAEIEPADAYPAFGFGVDVELDGAFLAVGDKSGRAHVFEGDASLWVHRHTTEAPPGLVTGQTVVDLEDGTLVVGAHGTWNTPAEVQVLDLADGIWDTTDLLLQPEELGTEPEQFGSSVALSGDRLAVGNPASDGTGTVLLYQRNEGAWSLDSNWTPVDAPQGAEVGLSVALSDDRLLAGAPGAPGETAEGLANGVGQATFWSVDGTSCPGLVALPSALSLEHGGLQSMWVNAGEERAGETYLVLGSFSGTQPGIEVPELTLPLNFDPWTVFTITSPNTPPYQNSFGLLDGNGSALVGFDLPTGLAPALAGLTLHHAVVTVGTKAGKPITELLGGPTVVTLTP